MSQQKLELHLEFQAIIMINVLKQKKEAKEAELQILTDINTIQKGKRSLIKLWFYVGTTFLLY